MLKGSEWLWYLVHWMEDEIIEGGFTHHFHFLVAMSQERRLWGQRVW